MDESTKKRLTKEYLLQLAKDTEGDNSIYRYGSEHSSSTKAPVLSTSRAEIVVGAFEENNKVPVFATLTRTGNPLYKMEIDPDRNSVLVKRTTVDYDQIAFTETMDQEENQDTKAFLVATLGAQNDLPDDNGNYPGSLTSC
ncbi:hypothetical protein BDZ45DRAFT_669095 [Acephala macrosclerotiorum]|nr:hypothetical protein BDZ45DRAFT_669095 [Acephala macrosclerotiorum]